MERELMRVKDGAAYLACGLHVSAGSQQHAHHVVVALRDRKVERGASVLQTAAVSTLKHVSYACARRGGRLAEVRDGGEGGIPPSPLYLYQRCHTTSCLSCHLQYIKYTCTIWYTIILRRNPATSFRGIYRIFLHILSGVLSTKTYSLFTTLSAVKRAGPSEAPSAL